MTEKPNHKWARKYFVAAIIILLLSVFIGTFGVKPVWVDDMPHYIQLTSNLMAGFGFVMLVLIIGYLMGCDYAWQVFNKQSNSDKETKS